MGIEQLKLILDAVRDVSGGAQLVAILWVLRTYFIVFVVGVVVIWIHESLRRHSSQDRVVRNSKRAILLVRRLTGREYPDEKDCDEIMRLVKAGRELERSKGK